MPVKRGPFAGDPEGARAYLADLERAGLWKARKPLARYDDYQVVRKANVFRLQEEAGVPIDNKASRGHADIIPVRPPVGAVAGVRAPGPAPVRPTGGQGRRSRKDVTIYPPPKMPTGRVHGPRGSSQLTTTRFAEVLRELKLAADEGKRVYFSLWDNRRGEDVKLYVNKGLRGGSANNGVDAADLRDRMREKINEARTQGRRMTERQALLAIWSEDIAGDVAGHDTPDDLALPQVITQISVHVIGS